MTPEEAELLGVGLNLPVAELVSHQGLPLEGWRINLNWIAGDTPGIECTKGCSDAFKTLASLCKLLRYVESTAC